jgi:hypothetical protein
MPAVTVALYGGLGNQMFQYAMGRALSLRHRIPLKLDFYGFDLDRRYRRSFELRHFAIPPEVEGVRRPVTFSCSLLLRRLSEARGEIAGLVRPWLLVEASADFDERNLAIDPRRNTYVMGYWQDERYFDHHGSTLRSDFTLAGGLSEANQSVADMIASVDAVAIHARRLHGGRGKEPEKALGSGYYQRAVSLIRSRVEKPHFIVFSDHPGWARENLTLGGPATFLEADRGPDHQDLVLMSLCRHQVIANSSFSWWGAWLARSEGQVVVAPEGLRYTPNLPASWIRIDGR